jgi:hypothetical protein
MTDVAHHDVAQRGMAGSSFWKPEYVVRVPGFLMFIRLSGAALTNLMSISQ